MPLKRQRRSVDRLLRDGGGKVSRCQQVCTYRWSPTQQNARVQSHAMAVARRPSFSAPCAIRMRTAAVAAAAATTVAAAAARQQIRSTRSRLSGGCGGSTGGHGRVGGGPIDASAASVADGDVAERASDESSDEPGISVLIYQATAATRMQRVIRPRACLGPM